MLSMLGLPQFFTFLAQGIGYQILSDCLEILHTDSSMFINIMTLQKLRYGKKAKFHQVLCQFLRPVQVIFWLRVGLFKSMSDRL